MKRVTTTESSFLPIHLLFILLLLFVTDEVKGSEGKNWMVAVGIINFADTRIPKLNYCVRDAEVLVDYFRVSGGEKTDITLLKNEEATREGILAGLSRVKENMSPEDTLIFYYSSHGIGDTEGNTYFVTFDTNKDDLRNTALPMQEIKNITSNLGVKNIVMLFDTCHSGGAKSLGQQNEKSYDNLMLAAGKKTRLAILTSSRTHENSVELPELRHGIFTYYLLKGMKGEADNFPRDGTISVTEIFDYVMVAVPRATDRAQHPTSKFSYNWPGTKAGPVPLGKTLSKYPEPVPPAHTEKKTDTAVKSTDQESEGGWQNVLDTAQ